jgi:metallo-beta-lactamase class B
MSTSSINLLVGFSRLLGITALFFLFENIVFAQSSGFQQHREAAQQSAGAEWGGVVDYLCTTGPITANRPDHPLIEPVQIFDNLYAIGRTTTVVYAITTSDGIILLDSGFGDQVDSVLLPGMAQLGLDPADIEYVIVAHGHADHYGGATHLQARFGVSVVASSADWDLMEETASNPSAVPPPTRDVVARDGEPITLGDGVVTPYLVPGHTPGAIGMVFPVHDGENTYTAALFGGMALNLTRLSDEALPQYLSSVERFSRLSEELGFNVVVQNHPLFDGMPEKLERLKTRRAGEPHPFLIPDGSYQRFMTTVSECSQAQVAAARD